MVCRVGVSGYLVTKPRWSAAAGNRLVLVVARRVGQTALPTLVSTMLPTSGTTSGVIGQARGVLHLAIDGFSRRGRDAAASELHLAATAFSHMKIHRAAAAASPDHASGPTPHMAAAC